MRAILTYHSIDSSGSPISVTPKAFRQHVEWLAVGTVRVVSVPELLALPDDVDAVAITFDDALESVASVAAPLLAAHSIPATVFVVTGHVGRDNRWNGVGDRGIPVQRVLDWGALGRLREQGFHFGAHSRTHRHLTQCSDAELADQLEGSAEDMRAATGERPVTFAYPYGAFDRRVAAAAAGSFDIACTTEFQAIRAGVERSAVPRLDAWYFTDASKLGRWGSAGFARGVKMRHLLRRIRRTFQ